MADFLAKTDPDTYSIADLERDGTTEWDGVRNPTAVNAIKSMKPGDRVFIYHSQSDTAVVGIAEIVSEPRPDPNEPRSWVADFKYVAHTKKPVTLVLSIPVLIRPDGGNQWMLWVKTSLSR